MPTDQELPEATQQSQSSTSQETNKRKRKVPLRLTVTQEDTIIEHIKSNPVLYDRGLREYRNVDLKKVLWKELSDTMKLPG